MYTISKLEEYKVVRLKNICDELGILIPSKIICKNLIIIKNSKDI